MSQATSIAKAHRASRRPRGRATPGRSSCSPISAGSVSIPTNDTLADHRHVRIAVGRDYADAAPTRGAVFGGGGSRLDVRVTVTEAGEPEPAVAPRAERPFLSETAPTPVAPRAGADQ